MDRDARITASGLVQAVINSGAPPEQWTELTNKAIALWATKAQQIHKLTKETTK